MGIILWLVKGGDWDRVKDKADTSGLNDGDFL